MLGLINKWETLTLLSTMLKPLLSLEKIELITINTELSKTGTTSQWVTLRELEHSLKSKESHLAIAQLVNLVWFHILKESMHGLLINTPTHILVNSMKRLPLKLLKELLEIQVAIKSTLRTISITQNQLMDGLETSTKPFLKNVHQELPQENLVWFHTFIVIMHGAQIANHCQMDKPGMMKLRLLLATKLL
jgi:hypothetical protein